MSLTKLLALIFASLVALSAATVGVLFYVATENQFNNEVDRFLSNRAAEIASGQRQAPQAEPVLIPPGVASSTSSSTTTLPRPTSSQARRRSTSSAAASASPVTTLLPRSSNTTSLTTTSVRPPSSPQTSVQSSSPPRRSSSGGAPPIPNDQNNPPNGQNGNAQSAALQAPSPTRLFFRSPEPNSEVQADNSQGSPPTTEEGSARNGGPSTRQIERNTFAVEPDTEVQVLNRQGDIDSNSGVLLPIDDQDRSLLLASGQSPIRTIDLGGVPYKMLSRHRSGGGVVQVARSMAEINNALEALRRRIGLIVFALLFVGAALGALLARRITKPLRALTAAVDKAAETRDLTVEVPITGGREVAHLGAGFQGLLTALSASRKQQRQLVQDASHELRTPLTSIRANVDFLGEAADVEAKVRHEVLIGVKAELVELSELIAEITDLAGESYELPPFVSTDLNQLARQAVVRFESRSPRAIKATYAGQSVIADADSIIRAISNLLSNAEKYSPQDSQIILEVIGVRVAVSDSGPGIDPLERARVFDRFYRSDSARTKPGSGLGLAIVARIIEQHGGHTFIETSASGGAIVGFELSPT